MINHANSTHGENGSYKPNRKGKGKLIENVIFDKILNMEHDYGRIRTEHEYSSEKDDFIRNLICTKCNHKENTKDAIKRHLQKVKCRGMEKIYDLNCPYCEETFKHLGSLNRHIYINEKCKGIHQIKQEKPWAKIWKDMCKTNKFENRFLED